MVGRSDEISKYYQNADLLLCTSKSESFGLSIIEAAQHNVPTISFDDCLGPKTLITNNINGFLIGSRDVNVYASRLTEVHKNFDLLNDMGYKARSMSEAYDKNQISAIWLDLLGANSNA